MCLSRSTALGLFENIGFDPREQQAEEGTARHIALAPRGELRRFLPHFQILPSSWITQSAKNRIVPNCAGNPGLIQTK